MELIFFEIKRKKNTLSNFHVSLHLAQVTFWISASYLSKFRTMTRANQFEYGLKTRRLVRTRVPKLLTRLTTNVYRLLPFVLVTGSKET
jgi:hypothetical protein